MARYIKAAEMLIAILLAALPCGCTSDNEKAAVTDASQDIRVLNWIQDIDYMQTNLLQKHKNLYHSIKKEDFDKEVIDLKNDVPKLKDYEIICRLAQIVASIGDAHTSLDLNFNNSLPYPIRLLWFGEDLRVVNTDSEHKDILGRKLVNINGIPINEIVKKADSLIAHENSQRLKAEDPQYIVIPEVLKMFGIISSDTAEFTFRGDDNSISKLKLTPGVLTPANRVSVFNEMPVRPLRSQYDYNSFTDNLYWYRYIPEDKILYFQYNHCTDKGIAQKRGIKDFEKYPDFDVFSEGLLKAISENDVGKFIIDLRYNSGGDSRLFTGLARKLAGIDKLKGKIYVMIGRETFSSAVIATIDLMNKTNAVFYGEPTGGNVNGYGNNKFLVLPNSKLYISYSTKYFNLSSKFKENFIPDVKVQETFKDFKDGIDGVYEAIRNSKN
ncbi:MAG TPA: hypothetical protein VHT96_15235 [Clostridia bacterium]|nr:hypothetical protein [Clostridia bacterium]